ncbi:hypothetical protein KBD33_02280 [Candidatus Gracilibacteria bacterium]|nr:hypothetical protein [Candidatus Gracilibacteria bacterium]
MLEKNDIHAQAISIYSQGGVDNFYNLLYPYSHSSRVGTGIRSQILNVMKMADIIHIQDERHDGTKYIHHNIRILLGYLRKYKNITPHDTMVCMLHDALEDHPESWKEIYDLVGVSIFRDILIFATGGIPKKFRTEMFNFFDTQFPDWWSKPGNSVKSPGQDRVFDIIRILSPANPLFKLETESKYGEQYGLEDSQKIEGAINYYKKYIIVPKNIEKDIEENDEYIALGNYLYFTKDNARWKLQDMLDNMSDMEKMEKREPGYIEKRRIKAYILGVKFKNFGNMEDEYAELENAFQKKGYTMLQDYEVLSQFRDPELH